jgi:hypothetical protein
MKKFLPCCILVALLHAAHAQQLTHTTPDGLKYTVTADGLSSLTDGGRTIASGGWYAWNAGPNWFKLGDEKTLAYGGYSKSLFPAVAKDISARTIEVLDAHRARVRHVQPGVVTTYEYSFNGEDCTIRARLENNSDEDISVPAFGGLKWTFAHPPTGNMTVWHFRYTQILKLGSFHPSENNKIGGSYAGDGQIGVGLTPLQTGLARTLFFWDYDDWNPGRRENVPVRWLSYLRPQPVPAGGARTFVMQMRLSRNTDWKHLLQPYKDHFRATFGDAKYLKDYRAVAVAHVNRNAEAIGPDNPYGFVGGFRRLDLKEGVQQFCDTLIPALKKANGQGVILWGQGGQNPRGAMYRPDFDILPPAVEANWPTLVKRFQEAGLRVGVTTRPPHLAYRLNWTGDGVMRISPDEPSQMAMLWKRFQNMIDKGVTMFYLDSFGGAFDDVRIVQYLRAKMGPEIQTFSEHQCDAMLPYSAVYSETDFRQKGVDKWEGETSYVPRAGLNFLEIGSWLMDTPIPVITRQYDVHGQKPAGFPTPEEFFYQHKMTPMIEDYRVGKKADEVRALQEKYIAANGMWK